MQGPDPFPFVSAIISIFAVALSLKIATKFDEFIGNFYDMGELDLVTI